MHQISFSKKNHQYSGNVTRDTSVSFETDYPIEKTIQMLSSYEYVRNIRYIHEHVKNIDI